MIVLVGAVGIPSTTSRLPLRRAQGDIARSDIAQGKLPYDLWFCPHAFAAARLGDRMLSDSRCVCELAFISKSSERPLVYL